MPDNDESAFPAASPSLGLGTSRSRASLDCFARFSEAHDQTKVGSQETNQTKQCYFLESNEPDTANAFRRDASQRFHADVWRRRRGKLSELPRNAAIELPLRQEHDGMQVHRRLSGRSADVRDLVRDFSERLEHAGQGV
jgi:hypothetical protein